MKKIVTIVGARPQFIKCSATTHAIMEHFSDRLEEILVHTGQHYDVGMSQIFFDELNIPAPSYNLGVGSGSHGRQTGAMLNRIEQVLEKEKPHAVLLFGDTNSTLAGALAASKLQIPIAHVEAGIRSHNKAMPEEINRITTDHLSTLLFTPTQAGMLNLEREGISPHLSEVSANTPGVFLCGDIMLDVAANMMSRLQKADVNLELPVKLSGPFAICTMHRESNTENETRIISLLKALENLVRSEGIEIIFSMHPRTSKKLGDKALSAIQRVKGLYLTGPLSYMQMQYLLSRCTMVLTDSGGLQKEAYFHHKPVVVLRTETEWVELLENGHAVVCDTDEQKIVQAVQHFLSQPPTRWPSLYGDGKAAQFICGKICEHL